ncbi:MAG: caffeoyl-CoA O-methyltransferase [Paraglaciecola sp.]|jgi:caffeoyl-CoA O-methyltransferase
MKKILQSLNTYAEKHTSAASDLLYQLERETYLKTLAPQMLSGHLQGRLLSFLSKMLQPKAILEIGTFTGYAAICLAEGLAENGVLHTIEVNRELEYLIRKYLKKGNLEEKIKSHIGDAKTVISTLPIDQFDLIMIDAGKKDNAYFYERVLPMLRPGGILLVDNVLWDGKVLEAPKDAMTRKILAFNEMIQADERVENLLLPIRDGMFVLRRREG